MLLDSRNEVRVIKMKIERDKVSSGVGLSGK